MNFEREMEAELTQNILPFWMDRMIDKQNGGYFGQITGNNSIVSDAPKGGILNARILWTFSAAYGMLKNQAYEKAAKRAKDYIFSYFFDEKFGGTYWLLHADGTPADTKKQIYSQAFFIYALAEYYKVFRCEEALGKAVELFTLIEKQSFDPIENGYFEAYSRDWKLLDDLRLSDKDANEKKTMNTHLHILEAYTNLYSVWKNDSLAKQLKNLILVFVEKIVNAETHHLSLFFDEKWSRKSNIISYGHDIEASWLLHEAALVLNDKEAIKIVEPMVVQIANATDEGFGLGRGMFYEYNPDTQHLNATREWWVQAETVVGYFNIYQYFGDEKALKKSLDCWDFIKHNLVDKTGGEWFWGLNADGTANRTGDKAGFWKCPYHNSRMCMEIMKRLDGDG